MKIIHIVENLDKGAVENWLVSIFIESRKTNPALDWTFYCILGKSGRLDELVKANGGKIIYSPVSISLKIHFLRALRGTLKSGNFDIIHSHHDYLSGFYLLASVGIKFKKRILHIHNTDKGLPIGNRTLHRLLLKPFKFFGLHFSDLIVGISNDSLQQFLHPVKLQRKKAVVLYYGIDLSRFETSIYRYELMTSIKMPENAILVLFSGRMTALKNPVFVVEILNELLKSDQRYYALFVGEGDLSDEVVQKAKSLGIEKNIRMLGWRTDLPQLMQVCDVFVFPRVEEPKEGLGLVVVEAQAAGLPIVLSFGIVPDAVIIPELAHFLPLNNNPEEWAARIKKIDKEISPEVALQTMKQSAFALPTATSNLLKLYEN